MLRLRAHLAAAAARSRFSDLVHTMSAKLPGPLQRLPIMTWHRVAPGLGPGFDRGVVDASPEQFDHQVATLKRSFSIIGTADLVSYHEEGRPLPPNPALLTFDDGYRDTATVALPILQKHRVKATFFVPTEFIESRKLFPWERIGALLARCRSPSVHVRYPETMDLSLENTETRFRSAEQLNRRVRERTEIDWTRFMNELADACGAPLDLGAEQSAADQLILDWSGVRALIEAGMDVQSHGDRHDLYPYLSGEAALRDATVSRDLLTSQTGAAPIAIAYPAGVGPARDSPAYGGVEKAGYRLGFCLDSRCSRVGFISDWLNLSRLSSESGMSREQFEGYLAFPNFLG